MTGRRKERRACGWILSLAAAFAVWGLLTAEIYSRGLFSTGLLNESISAGSFLDRRYELFEAEVENALAAANLPKDLMGREELYDRFLLDLKKQILGNEAEGKEGWLAELAQETISAYLREQNLFVTAEAEAGILALSENIQGMENRYTAIPEMSQWRQVQGEFQSGKRGICLGLAVLFLGTAAAAAGIQHRKYRVLGVVGTGGVLGSILAAVTFFAVWFAGQGARGETAGIFWTEASKVCLVFCGTGAAVSACAGMLELFLEKANANGKRRWGRL